MTAPRTPSAPSTAARFGPTGEPVFDGYSFDGYGTGRAREVVQACWMGSPHLVVRSLKVKNTSSFTWVRNHTPHDTCGTLSLSLSRTRVPPRLHLHKGRPRDAGSLLAPRPAATSAAAGNAPPSGGAGDRHHRWIASPSAAAPPGSRRTLPSRPVPSRPVLFCPLPICSIRLAPFRVLLRESTVLLHLDISGDFVNGFVSGIVYVRAGR